jgi:putative salt-induced outer membrane protein
MFERSMFKRCYAVIMSALLPGLALADNWTGKGELGLAQSSANTGASSTTLAAKFDVVIMMDKWKHAFGASTVYTTSKSEPSEDDPEPLRETAAKRWEVHEQSDYNFGPRAFWFGAVRHEHDDVGSFVYQSTISTGVGYKFFDNDATTLSGQLGLGYKHFRNRIESSSDDNTIWTGGVDFKQKLTDNTTLLDKVFLESGGDNSLIQNVFGFQVKMTDVLALSIGHEVRYNTKPGPRAYGAGNYAHSDRLLTINLVYEIK